jgi:hypothetical protein
MCSWLGQVLLISEQTIIDIPVRIYDKQHELSVQMHQLPNTAGKNNRNKVDLGG